MQEKVSEETEKNRKKYAEIKERSRIQIRLNAEQLTLLELKKEEEEWSCMSTMIKSMLFNEDARKDAFRLVGTRDPHAACVLLKNCVLDLTDKYLYALYRYDKDMKTLYEEEGVDMKKWTKATNRWNRELVNSTNEVLVSIRKMMDMFGLEAYRETTREVPYSGKRPTKEEEDRIAEEMFKEIVALGGTFE